MTLAKRHTVTVYQWPGPLSPAGAAVALQSVMLD